MISDQNCTTRSSITTLLHPFWNHSFFLICIYWSKMLVRKKRNRKHFYMYVHVNKTKWQMSLYKNPLERKNFIQTVLKSWNGQKSLIQNFEKLNYGNWTKRSAIWSEIIRVISKSNERAARVWFEITSMISDQNCTTRSSITTLLHPFWNRRI